MRALRLEDGALEVREVERPHGSGGNEALVRVRLSGICATDLELVRGYYPFTGVIGHEFVGEVVSVPRAEDTATPDAHPSVGSRVVGEINAACGACAMCGRGLPTHCEARTVLGIVGRHGAHAEYVTLPPTLLHEVPDGVPDEAAVFTEPLAAALEILEQVRVRPSDRVLVVGAGRLGQLCARVLRLAGADLAVVARYDRQRSLLRAHGIAAVTEELDAGVEPRSYDVVVEATGAPSGLDTACGALRPRGTLVLKSTYQGETTLDLSPFVVDEITVVGSRCGPFPPALRLLEDGLVDPTDLIDYRYPLERGVEAMDAAARPGAMKVLLEP